MKKAFSLVELSVVLVILGLITGGILTGQSLIRAAELRKLTSDVSGYNTAVYTFRTKYRSLPGDMNNATFFWGAADAGDGVGADCFTVDQTAGTATCNGNNNGNINEAEGGNGTVWELGERFTAWKHLSNAGLVPGAYSGKTDSATIENNVTAGVNTPESIDGNPFVILTTDVGSTFYYGPTSARNALLVRNDPLTPEEAWRIDKKLDDAKPGTGNIRSTRFVPADPTNCADNADGTLAEYVFTDTTEECSLLILGL